MAWIESHQTLGRHPKTRRLARLLACSLPAAVGHLHFLWWWAVDFAQDGSVGAYDCQEIADAALWEGDPADFRAALVATGFLDADTAMLHDWQDYAGRLIDQREKAKARTRAWREQHKPAPAPAVMEPVSEPYADVTHNVRVRYETTVPNLTVPDHTVHNQTVPNHEDTQAAPEPPRPVAPASIGPAKPAKYSPAFEAFWAAYPRQDGRAWPKPTAYDEWRKLRPDGELADAILAGVVAWKAGRDWRCGYISRPDRWLKARSWEEPPEAWSGVEAVEQRAPIARASPNGRQSKMDIIAAGLGMTRRPTDDRTRAEPGPGEFIDVVAASGDGRGHRVAVAGTLP